MCAEQYGEYAYWGRVFFYWHREKLGGEGGWRVGGLIPFGFGLSYFTISISRMCTVYPRPLRSCLCPWSCLYIGLRNGVIKGSFPYHRDCFESLRLAVKSAFRTTLKFCCMHEDRKLGCERRNSHRTNNLAIFDNHGSIRTTMSLECSFRAEHDRPRHESLLFFFCRSVCRHL